MAKQKGATALIGLPKAVYKFILEARDELKKVSWPTRQATARYTVIVVIASLSVGLIIGGIDYVLQLVLERVLNI